METLVLDLKMDGNTVNYAVSGKDFKRRFYIGTDRFLLWQILEDHFPKRHRLIERHNGFYQLNLLPGMTFQGHYNGVTVTEDNLRELGLMKKSSVLLMKGLKGTIHLGKRWSVSFSHVNRTEDVPEPERKRIRAELAHYPAMEPAQKYTLLTMLAALVLTLSLSAWLTAGYQPMSFSTLEPVTASGDNILTDPAVRIDFGNQIQTIPEYSNTETGETGNAGDPESSADDTVPSEAARGLMSGNLSSDGDLTTESAAGRAMEGTGGNPLGESYAGLRSNASSLFDSKGGEMIQTGKDRPFVPFNPGQMHTPEGTLIGDLQPHRDITSQSGNRFQRVAGDGQRQPARITTSDLIPIQTDETNVPASVSSARNRISRFIRSKTYRLRSIMQSRGTVETVFGTLIITATWTPEGKITDISITQTRDSSFSVDLIGLVRTAVQDWNLPVRLPSETRYSFKIAVAHQ